MLTSHIILKVGNCIRAYRMLYNSCFSTSIAEKVVTSITVKDTTVKTNKENQVVQVQVCIYALYGNYETCTAYV